MAPHTEEDWSDSDDDGSASELETSVLLGLPDGPVDSVDDLRDVAVSRMGGHPAFLTAPEPDVSASQCRNCSNPMELLVQIWCPFEESPMDRALYVWGCARGECQRKEGSVRAWRNLRYNADYAKKLEAKLEKRRKQEEVRKAAEKAKEASKINPFKANGTTPAAAGAFGLGAQVFGGSNPFGNANPFAPPLQQAEPDHDDEPEEDEAEAEGHEGGDASSSSSEESLVTALASTSLEDSPWPAMPSYTPLYLNTTSEYLPSPPPKPKLPPGAQLLDADEGGKDAKWLSEAYENSMEVDHVFERFMTRVGHEGKQCVRYDLGGTPLPFGHDSVFDKLFPAPAGPPVPVTKGEFMVQPPQKRVYTPAALPKCPQCGGERVFECQLMPNLINVLKSSSADDARPGKLTEEERKKEIERALKAENSTKRRGMEWGTVMVFSCKSDCCPEQKKNWAEEVVLVQWDE
ncbi:hypothetical protein GLOTRDRAFT_59670 [Gloeophyllum trabeum ATCC 11539]|uniref:Programmed cell death protein 2 C-terminal domain-containing protein n=1 Tax=Gloeophyllum trabeum (strain ATCC 11539 / FP-39264 / Madison 617) TaxID=670483 RepID=S7Q8W6_GLOTA|nr:uncharacterized protein GLOTRDRAFT_59670 [Gloeophyllum trabeum ATCC 11539]EPQ56421.1 hypothetical protein GLOTRDRAFT_59670 [Gloeophyllum trabeum ATCC 11539]